MTSDKGKSKQGQWPRVERDLSGVERGKGFCYQWKAKGQGSKEDQCSFWHESTERAPIPTPKAAPPSEQSMTRGGSESRRGRSQTDRILRQPCRYCLKGTCTRSLCEYWHLPESQFHKKESGCKAEDNCLFPHYKVEEQPSKKTKKSFELSKRKKATTKRRWLL